MRLKDGRIFKTEDDFGKAGYGEVFGMDSKVVNFSGEALSR